MPDDSTLTRIPLDAIRVDPTVQQRAAGTCQDVVDEYAEEMRNGVKFPPIDVFGYDEGHFISAAAFTPWRPINWRTPTRKISNVGFTPAVATMHFYSPAARTPSMDCGAIARTR